MAGFDLGGMGVASKLLNSIFGGTVSNGWDPRVQDYYNKHGDSIYAEATAGQSFDPVSGGLTGGKDLYATTLARMQADPSTAGIFDQPKATASPTAGGQQVAGNDAAAAAATAAAQAAALTKANTSTDLSGENKNLTIAGGSADAASATVDDNGKKKRSPTGLASSLGINV